MATPIQVSPSDTADVCVNLPRPTLEERIRSLETAQSATTPVAANYMYFDKRMCDVEKAITDIINMEKSKLKAHLALEKRISAIERHVGMRQPEADPIPDPILPVLLMLLSRDLSHCNH